jgi:hypothetical protein
MISIWWNLANNYTMMAYFKICIKKHIQDKTSFNIYKNVKKNLILIVTLFSIDLNVNHLKNLCSLNHFDWNFGFIAENLLSIWKILQSVC